MNPLNREEKAIQALHDELKQLLADALRVADETRAESDRVAEASRVETDRVQHVHDDEMSATEKAHGDEMTAAQKRHDDEMVTEQHIHEAEMHNMDLALATRDVIGQAKGIIMATMQCTAEDAFRLLVKQSQAENCKLVEIATEIARRVSRRAAGVADSIAG